MNKVQGVFPWKSFFSNRRGRTLAMIAFAAVVLVAVALAGLLMSPAAYAPDYGERLAAPSPAHPFGTDYLGRDMFSRTVKGLSTSILIGMSASAVSACIALLLGLLSALGGKRVDRLVLGLVDVFMGMPHLVLLMLISIAAGKGLFGVVVGVAFTHWPNLTRVVRAEVLEVRSAHYVKAAARFGVHPVKIAARHILPHVLPQFVVGLILLFPHAILHEASITFLGFGLSVDMPAIGVILSEAMKHLATGMWWLVVFPGAALLAVVLLFDALGESLKALTDPRRAQE